jgi:hypothetical protein
MDWTYSAIMLAAVVTGLGLFRRQPRPPDVQPRQMASNVGENQLGANLLATCRVSTQDVAPRSVNLDVRKVVDQFHPFPRLQQS